MMSRSVRFFCLLGGAALLVVGDPAHSAGIYSSTVLADSPLAYYQLDETTGPTAFNSGTAAGIDATFQNIPGTSATNGSLLGQSGPAHPGFDASNRAVLFDPEVGATAAGTNSPRIEVPWNTMGPNPLAIDGSTGLTLEAWVYRNTPVVAGADNEGIISRYLNGNGFANARAYELYYDDDINAFALAVSNDGTFKSTAVGGTLEALDYDVPLNEWIHVVGTYELNQAATEATLKLYANGEEIASATTTTVLSLYTGAAPLWIGQQFTNAASWTFEGLIDEAAIYDYALSGEQIRAHYQAAVVPEPSTLLLGAGGVALALLLRRKGTCRSGS